MHEFRVQCANGHRHEVVFRPARTTPCMYCGELFAVHVVQYRKVSKWHAIPHIYGPTVVTV